MFIKNLIISNPPKIIRNIEFKSGLNLIIDNTPTFESKSTGNNVGKTTVLKLIDFCLGGKASNIYTDTENKKEVYNLIKDYLIGNKIEITLKLVKDLNDPYSEEVIIKRNFLSKKNAIRTINGVPILEKEFEKKLLELIIPNHKLEKPTFRQIISHNIRYKDENINNTLKTLDKFTKDVEYETLYLFLLGCTIDNGARKQVLIAKLKQEESFKERLEHKETKNAYEVMLSLVESEIEDLKKKKSNLNLNENFENDLEKLDIVKYKINKCSSLITKMKIRRDLIEETKIELENSKSNIDLYQLKYLYNEAKMNVSGIQKTFEDLVNYHNKMIVEKSRFIIAELPELNRKISKEERIMLNLLEEEKALSNKITKGKSFAELEKIIEDLSEKYRKKGEYESAILQIEKVESSIDNLKNDIKNIDDILFSNDSKEKLKNQINKFNKYFSSISEELYGEKYALKYEIVNKNNKQLYKFNAFNTNISSGKKQGEILCFDLAYTLFADNEKIPCLHFLLNDKKELMHNNQLIKVSEFVRKNDIQLIISILKDKLPEESLRYAHIAAELSQKDKLFKIETKK